MKLTFQNIAVFALLAFFLASCGELDSPVGLKAKTTIESVTKWRVDSDTDERIEKIHYKQYDANGNIILAIFYDSGDVSSEVVFEYEDDGFREIETIFTEGEAIKSVTDYVLNSDGRITIEKSFDPQGDLKETIEYEYDDGGRLVSEKKFDSSGELSKSADYSYALNDQGNVINRFADLGGGTVTRDSIFYAPNERIVRNIKFDIFGDISKITTFKYSPEGAVIEETAVTVSTGKIDKFVYDYVWRR